jgi:hypothetical protein
MTPDTFILSRTGANGVMMMKTMRTARQKTACQLDFKHVQGTVSSGFMDFRGKR